MRKLLSVNFWATTFLSTFMTMVFIYLIKVITAKVEIPVVSNIAQSV